MAMKNSPSLTCVCHLSPGMYDDVLMYSLQRHATATLCNLTILARNPSGSCAGAISGV